MRQEIEESRETPNRPAGADRNRLGRLWPIRAVVARPALWLPVVASLLISGLGNMERPVVEAALHDVAGFQRPLLHRPLRMLPNPVFDGWDSRHYRALADEYAHPAWPPLYPMAVLLLSHILQPAIPSPGNSSGQPFAEEAVSADAFRGAAQLINLASMVAIAALLPAFLRLYRPPEFRSPAPTKSDERALMERDVAAVLFVFFFPGHNVFFAAYTEGLFLALSLAALVFYRRQQWLLSGIMLGLMVLTRYQGIFLAVAIPALHLLEGGPGAAGTEGTGAWMAKRHRGFAVLLRLSAGVLMFAVWVPVAIYWTGQSPFAAVSPWSDSLVGTHIQDGTEPHLWVFQYLVWNGPGSDRLWFLVLIAGTLYLWWKGERVGALFLTLFLLSFLVHVYRPFAFSRYMSALAPVYLLFDLWIGRYPILRMLVLPAALAYSIHTQLLLFSGLFGEP